MTKIIWRPSEGKLQDHTVEIIRQFCENHLTIFIKYFFSRFLVTFKYFFLWWFLLRITHSFTFLLVFYVSFSRSFFMFFYSRPFACLFSWLITFGINLTQWNSQLDTEIWSPYFRITLCINIQSNLTCEFRIKTLTHTHNASIICTVSF